MRRHILGIIGLSFIGVWAYFLSRYGSGDDKQSMAVGILGRAGFTMVALWLAFPQVEELARRVSPLVIFGCIFGLGILVWRPRLFIVVLPVLGVLLALNFVKWLFAPLPDTPQDASKKTPNESKEKTAKKV